MHGVPLTTASAVSPYTQPVVESGLCKCYRAPEGPSRVARGASPW
jgi:hypothetical protein